jgi:hypothetical protein
LDELAVYAGEVKKKEPMSKEAGIFSEGSALVDANRGVSDLEKSVNSLQFKFDNAQAKLRAILNLGGEQEKLDGAIGKADAAQQAYQERSNLLQSALHEAGDLKQKESKKNMTIAASVGLPGLAGLGYAYQNEKNK